MDVHEVVREPGSKGFLDYDLDEDIKRLVTVAYNTINRPERYFPHDLFNLDEDPILSLFTRWAESIFDDLDIGALYSRLQNVHRNIRLAVLSNADLLHEIATALGVGSVILKYTSDEWTCSANNTRLLTCTDNILVFIEEGDIFRQYIPSLSKPSEQPEELYKITYHVRPLAKSYLCPALRQWIIPELVYYTGLQNRRKKDADINKYITATHTYECTMRNTFSELGAAEISGIYWSASLAGDESNRHTVKNVRVVTTGLFFSYYALAVYQKSNKFVLEQQELEIEAGLGRFGKDSSPKRRKSYDGARAVMGKTHMYEGVDILGDFEEREQVWELSLVQDPPQNWYPGPNYGDLVKTMTDSQLQDEVLKAVAVVQTLLMDVGDSLRDDMLCLLKNSMIRVYNISQIRAIRKVDVNPLLTYFNDCSRLRHDQWQYAYLNDKGLAFTPEETFNNYALRHGLNQVDDNSQTPDHICMLDGVLHIYEFAVTVNPEDVRTAKVDKYLDLVQSIKLKNPHLKVDYKPLVLSLFDYDFVAENSHIYVSAECMKKMKLVLKIYTYWNNLISRLDTELVSFARRNEPHRSKPIRDLVDHEFFKREPLSTRLFESSIPVSWSEGGLVIKSWLDQNSNIKAELVKKLKQYADTARVSIVLDMQVNEFEITEDYQGRSPYEIANSILRDNPRTYERAFHSMDIAVYRKLIATGKITQEELFNLACKHDIPDSLVRSKLKGDEALIHDFADPIPPKNKQSTGFMGIELARPVLKFADCGPAVDTLLSNPKATADALVSGYRKYYSRMVYQGMFLADKKMDLAEVIKAIDAKAEQISSMPVEFKNKASLMLPLLPRDTVTPNEASAQLIMISSIQIKNTVHTGHRSNLGLLESCLSLLPKAKPIKDEPRPEQGIQKNFKHAAKLLVQMGVADEGKILEARDELLDTYKQKTAPKSSTVWAPINRSLVSEVAVDCKGKGRVLTKQEVVEGYGYSPKTVLESEQLINNLINYMCDATKSLGPNVIQPEVSEDRSKIGRAHV